MQHYVSRLPKLASSNLFAAPTAENWKALMLESQLEDLDICSTTTVGGLQERIEAFQSAEKSSNFEQCAILDSIGAPIYGIQRFEAADRCRNLLIAWCEKNQAFLATRKQERAGLIILWHSIFLSLHADFDTIERACGRDGDIESQEASEYARKWANSMDGRRCLLHATHIRVLFESLPLGTEPPIHIPICLYHCGIIYFCSSKFTHKIPSWLGQDVHFPELSLPGVHLNDHEIRNMSFEDIGSVQIENASPDNTWRVIDLLQRVGHWKIAQNFAGTLLALVERDHGIL